MNPHYMLFHDHNVVHKNDMKWSVILSVINWRGRWSNKIDDTCDSQHAVANFFYVQSLGQNFRSIVIFTHAQILFYSYTM